MYTVSKQFSAVGRSGGMLLKEGRALVYRVDLSSDWDGTLVLRKSSDGGQTWTAVQVITAEVTGTLVTAGSPAVYEFACSVFTAGTADCYLFDLSATGVERDRAGGASVRTVVA